MCAVETNLALRHSGSAWLQKAFEIVRRQHGSKRLLKSCGARVEKLHALETWIGAWLLQHCWTCSRCGCAMLSPQGAEYLEVLFTCLYTCLFTRLGTFHTHVHAHVRAHVYAHGHKPDCTNMYTLVRTHVCTPIYTHVYTHVHALANKPCG